MSDAKFTKGPWTHVSSFPTSIWAGEGEATFWIGSTNVDAVKSLEERTGNAQLMAAALDMYKVLVSLLPSLYNAFEPDNQSAAYQRVIAAIAKAEGRELSRESE
jgi:hypothetical protein